jgi:hypothetical protein
LLISWLRSINVVVADPRDTGLGESVSDELRGHPATEGHLRKQHKPALTYLITLTRAREALAASPGPSAERASAMTVTGILSVCLNSTRQAMTVAKLKAARDRVRWAQCKCEGRKAYAERKGGHELVALPSPQKGLR